MIESQMLLDDESNAFVEKETIIILNLISKSRPNTIKPIGRVTVDLGSVLNNGAFSIVEQNPLKYCPIKATI